MDSPTHGSLIGETIGNYRVVAKLGEGGMGAVYLAEHPLIGKKVALKVLREDNADAAERFFDEARAVTAIGHPNIVDILDFGVVERSAGSSFVYLTMEFLAGESLGALLAREGPLPVERAIDIALQTADALAACHENGVIHRDLKPDNVFVVPRPDGDLVKLLDFGIAKLAHASRRHTGKGMVIGTPAYMSPEQCEGRRDIDERADVYALGILMYEMITGAVPFSGEGYGDVLNQHLTRPPLPPSAIRGLIPSALEAIVLRALEKRRDDRFASMPDLADALRDPSGFFASRPPHSSRGGVLPLPLPPPREPAVADVPRPSTLTHSVGERHTGPTPRSRRTSRLSVMVASGLCALLLLGGAGVWLVRDGQQLAEPRTGTAGTPPIAPAPSPVVPPPVVTPVPAPEPATVRLAISSQPAGALLLVNGVAHDRTPVVLELPRDDLEITLTFKLPGYRDKVRTVHPNRDADIEVGLDRLPRRPAPTPEPAANMDDGILAPRF